MKFVRSTRILTKVTTLCFSKSSGNQVQQCTVDELNYEMCTHIAIDSIRCSELKVPKISNIVVTSVARYLVAASKTLRI